jgi:hypothetical protein
MPPQGWSMDRAIAECVPFAAEKGTHNVPYLKPEFGIRNNKPMLSFIKVNLLPQTAWPIQIQVIYKVCQGRHYAGGQKNLQCLAPYVRPRTDTCRS